MNADEIVNKMEELLANIIENQKELYKRYRDLKYTLIFTVVGLCIGYVVGMLL